MEMPLVSIIVPVYNAQSHLSRCLESICGQEYKNLELIVINDGSKDKSLPVCEEFRKKDSRILLVDKANSGVSDTRNLGLKLAGGKYDIGKKTALFFRPIRIICSGQPYCVKNRNPHSANTYLQTRQATAEYRTDRLFAVLYIIRGRYSSRS